MNFGDLLDEAVKTLPVIGETHWIKFYLASKRFAARYPHWHADDFEVLVERTQFQQQPKVTSLFAPSVTKRDPRYSPIGAPRLISRGLFPLVYLAARDWHEDQGFEEMVLAFKGRAIHEGTYLGHGWSVWCSFYEALDDLEDSLDKLFAVERFAEFASFAFRGYPSSDSSWSPPMQSDPGDIEFSVVFDAALHRPGFFGHNILTLGYLLRHQDILSDLEWRVGLSTVLNMTETVYKDDEDNVVMEYTATTQDGLAELDLETAVRHLLFEGPKDVHSVTLADICCDLWVAANEEQQSKLLQYLQSFHE
jgi:hypothetical protein